MSSSPAQPALDWGLVGAGVMGAALARNVASRGFRVGVVDTDAAKTAALGAVPGIAPLPDLSALVAALSRPRRVLIMVPAGGPVDAVRSALEPLLEPGDVVVDGGNSDFRETRRREAEWAARGLGWVGMGVSGGEQGALTGPSLMPGGPAHAWDALQPVLEAIAARTPAGPCVTHVGPDGAGHFVKMVHNGIEYADMQLLAEAWDLLARGLDMAPPACAEVFAEWNAGRLDSFLVDITAQILRREDPDSGRPLVELVLDRAGQKGTGRWTVMLAAELGVAVPTIAAALDARVLSSDKAGRTLRATLTSAPPVEEAAPQPRAWLADLEAALFAGKVLSYAQGFELMRAAAGEYDWSLDPAELARIWMGGCIIRATLLERVRAAFLSTPDLPHLAFADELRDELTEAIGGLRRVVAFAARRGLPVPALSASLAYFDALRTAELPQSLTQAQRDAFGAHTYRRKDDPEGPPVHTDWLDATAP